MIGIDTVTERLDFAQSKSGIEVLDFSKHTDVVKYLQELVPGGLDVAIDCGTVVAYIPGNAEFDHFIRYISRAEDTLAQSSKDTSAGNRQL